MTCSHTALTRTHSLAALNTWKFALFDLPLGGAKLGVACDPRFMDLRFQESLTRKLTSVSWSNGKLARPW